MIAYSLHSITSFHYQKRQHSPSGFPHQEISFITHPNSLHFHINNLNLLILLLIRTTMFIFLRATDAASLREIMIAARIHPPALVLRPNEGEDDHVDVNASHENTSAGRKLVSASLSSLGVRSSSYITLP